MEMNRRLKWLVNSLCLSHPGTQGIPFRAPGRPITGVTATRTPLMLPICSLDGAARWCNPNNWILRPR
jgi:hypothetical protein